MKQPIKKQPIKICSCGKEYNVIPDTAKRDNKAILPGWYWNCACGSTLVLPLAQIRAAVMVAITVLLAACGGSDKKEAAAQAGITCNTLAGSYYNQFAPSETLTISNSCTFTDSVCGYDASYSIPNAQTGASTVTVNNTNGTPGCMSNTSHSCTLEYNGVQLGFACTDSITGNVYNEVYIRQ